MRYFDAFSGVGGFALGIQQAYETTRNIDVQKKRGGETSSQGELQEDGEGLHPISGERTISSDDRNNEHTNRGFNKRQPHCIGFSEIDKYAIQVYNKHFNHKNYGDITKIKSESLPDFDLLVGGFPCQSFSIAGKRGGFNDTRGTMFFEIARIVREKQPRLLLLENVKGLLSHDKGNTFFTIISTLDELGYDCQWQVLNSKNFGVPQNRERVFIIGHLRGTSRPEVFPIGGANKQAIEQINQPTHSNDRVYGIKGISPTLNTMQGGNRQPFIGSIRTSGDRGKQKTYIKNNEIQTLSANPMSDNIPRIIKKYEKLSTMQGGGENKLQPVEEKNKRVAQNGVNGKTDSEDNRKGEYNSALSYSQIRRLTPKECERLQGFPDDWTKYGTLLQTGENGKLYDKQVSISDSQRYKMCGNAVTVNVIKEIVKKLCTY